MRKKNPPFRIMYVTLLAAIATSSFAAGLSSTADFRHSITQSSNNISLDFNLLHNPTMRQTHSGSEPLLQGFSLAGKPGEPVLPSRKFRILLPDGVSPQDCQVLLKNAKWRTMDGTFDLAPLPPPAAQQGERTLLGWTPETLRHIVKGRDSRVYRVNAFHPANPLTSTPAAFRQWNVVEVELVPVRWNPVSGQMLVLESGSIVVSWTQPGARGTNRLSSSTPRAERFWESFSKTLENPTLEASSLVQNAASSVAQTSAVSATPDFLVITTEYINNTLKDSSLGEFIYHKEMLGYNVAVITEATFADDAHYLSGYSQITRAENIRQWLQAHYLLWGVEHVLLIGDPRPIGTFYADNSVPMKMCYANPANHNDFLTPTDFYYAELSGNWDRDGDGFPGEYGDRSLGYEDFAAGGIDRLAEVTVGRIPFYGSLDDLTKILRKIVSYEQKYTGEIWRKKLLVAAAISNFSPEDHNNDGDVTDSGEWQDTSLRTFGGDWAEKLKTLVTPANYETYTLYEKEGPYADGSAYPLTTCNAPLNSENFKSAWGNHHGFVTWWAHGSSTGAYRRKWNNDLTRADEITQFPQETSDLLFYSYADMPLLDDTTPSFVLMVACDNGTPENINNLGYAALRNGAIATVSSTRLSWYAVGSWSTSVWPSVGDNASYGYKITERMVNYDADIGTALNYCRSTFGMSWDHQSWQNILDFNVYGDASVSPALLPSAPPVLDLNGEAAGINHSDIFYENSGGLPLLTGDSSLTDSDSATLQWADIVLEPYIEGDDLLISPTGTLQATLLLDNGDNTATMRISGNDSPAAYREILTTVRFVNTGEDPLNILRTLRMRVHDGTYVSQVAEKSVEVIAENDAPEITLPNLPWTWLDSAVSFDGVDTGRLSLHDADDLRSSVTLSVDLLTTCGLLTLGSTQGLSNLSGDGTAAVAFSGTLHVLNAALDGLVFEPTAGFTGAANIHISADDGGDFGSGGTKRTTVSLTVDVREPIRSESLALSPGEVQTENVFSIPVVSWSTGTSVTAVALYYRKDGGGWAQYGSDLPPTQILAEFNAATTGGDGFYEFYTRCLNDLGFWESPHEEADTWTLVVTQFNGEVIFVDSRATLPDTGADWAHPCPKVGMALYIAAAFQVPEIRVASGEYAESLEVRNSVAILGGYPLDGDRSLRDAQLNLTVINAATVENGGPADHVVKMDGLTSVTLDGFTLRGAVADGGEDESRGAGIFLRNCDASVVVRDCRIVDNFSVLQGGGVYSYASSPTLVGCVIERNHADYGGGFYAYSGGPVLTSCTLSLNQAYDGGGAMWQNGAGSLLTSTIISNEAEAYGGGLHVAGGAVSVRACRIGGNRANAGGGIHMRDGAESLFENCIIAGNSASDGAGILADSSSATLRNCAVVENVADHSGGGVFLKQGAYASLINTILSGNAPVALFDSDRTCRIEGHSCLFFNNGGGDVLIKGDAAIQGADAINAIGGMEGCLSGDSRFRMNEVGNTFEATFISYDAASSRTAWAFSDGPGGEDTLADKFVWIGDAPQSIALVTTNTTDMFKVAGDWAANAGTTVTCRFMDLMPADGSLALDTGTSIGATPDDMRGRIRPIQLIAGAPGTGFDIGPYENDTGVAPSLINLVALAPPSPWAEPLSLVAGVVFDIPTSCSMINEGNAPSGEFRYAIYLSEDDQITTGDLLAGMGDTPSLLPGETFTGGGEVEWRLPDEKTSATFYVALLVDAPGEIEEQWKSDNVVILGMANVEALVRNLIVETDTAPFLVTMEQSTKTLTVPASWRVLNYGNQDTGDFQVGLYLSVDGTIDPSDHLLTLLPVGSLAPGAAWSPDQPVEVTIPNDTAIGTVNLLLWADCEDILQEDTEDDNLATLGSIEVTSRFKTMWIVR